ncbi:MAG: hypothetical protein PHH06_00355 [Candidatus Gracilibacteria bacterium]|nr:hypothetical protein [Candidatus Gracilibacteria bacterium]
MPHFTTKKISGELVGIIDVGSYKIRVAICEYHSNSINVLTFSEKRQSSTDIVNNKIKNLEGICENIELAIKKAEKEAGVKLENIIINPLFSDTFFYSKKISYNRKDSDKKINETELFDIVSKVEEIGVISASKKIEKNYLYKIEDLDIILSNISEIKIDNKIVDNPLNETGTHLMFHTLNIFIAKSNYELISYIGSYLNKNILKILPEEFCLAKIWEKDKSVVIINIGNSSSFITIKDDFGNIVGSIKLDVGIETLINKICEVSDFSRAEIIKKIDRSDFFIKEKKEFLDIYSFLIIEGIKEIIGDNICINNFFIVGGGGNNEFFKNYFEKVDFNSLGLKISGKIKFVMPDIDKLCRIDDIENILCKSNLNIISMILAYNSIVNKKQDFIEKAIEKVLKKLVK